MRKLQENHLKSKGSPKVEVNAEKMIDGLKWIARRGGFKEAHWVSSSLNTKKSVLKVLHLSSQGKWTRLFSRLWWEPTNPKYRSYVIIPVYDNVSSHPSDVRFVVSIQNGSKLMKINKTKNLRYNHKILFFFYINHM